ncbi:MAG: DivIVA domain-containing protein [Erysipelotrichaceae bacterium]|nr:DivIVA domain-containing protein [Erysipelotrichaceae bacterium]
MAPQFNKKFRGYDPEEVSAYINDLEKQLIEANARAEVINNKLVDLQTRNSELENKYARTKQDYALLVNRSAINDKTNEEIARLALKEASELIEKAKRNANMILTESMEYVRGLNDEVDDLKDQAKDFRAEVVKISTDLIETIDKSNIFSLINEETIDVDTEVADDLIETPFDINDLNTEIETDIQDEL